ncbi:MAG: hydrogen peroxide-inducible genes activator [Gammaproteobacteria bacterium]|nr:hydrogen peroxide-inducible genes activator [Gammaproteobacteria bacterium]
MISTKQLMYALAVEKTLHFKKAAERCNISQSALSTALNELERQLGLQIFERDNKKVLVTPIGQDVLKRASQIMLQVEDLQQLGASQKAPLNYPLSVGVIPTIAPYLLPKIFSVLAHTHPEAQLNIVEEQSHTLVDMVRSGEIDTAILALPYPCEGLLSLEFWQEDFYWVAVKGEPYTGQTEITSDELTHSKLMLLKDGHCLKDHILDVCKITEQSANHGFGATSLNTLVQMVSGKMGTTLIPEMALEQLISQNSALTAVHLNEPGPHRRIAFLIRPNYTRMHSIETLMQLCKGALNEYLPDA